MKSNTNKQRLTNLLKGMQRSIDLFESQGYNDVYFTAQFLKGGRKQNGIDRGDVHAFATQVRTYVDSEDADTVRIEFIDESTSKSIYSKVLTDLSLNDGEKPAANKSGNGLGGLDGYSGLGMAEVKQLVAKEVSEARREDEYQRMSKELEEYKTRASVLQTEKTELEATLAAKRDTEYYMGIIGAAFPGLATLFTGTPLAQAANFLAGTSETEMPSLPAPAAPASSEGASVGAMVAEFCGTLDKRYASAMHLLCIAFEKDHEQILHALKSITLDD